MILNAAIQYLTLSIMHLLISYYPSIQKIRADTCASQWQWHNHIMKIAQISNIFKLIFIIQFEKRKKKSTK